MAEQALKRLHIGLKVDDIERSVDFYKRLFGAEPTLQRDDYAKWMLDDPRVNFTIDVKGPGKAGSAHYGIQVESPQALEEARGEVDAAGLARADQDDVTCCHHVQSKSWVADPNGLPWELFFTQNVADDYGHESFRLPGESFGDEPVDGEGPASQEVVCCAGQA